jgi:hypothetical protein
VVNEQGTNDIDISGQGRPVLCFVMPKLWRGRKRAASAAYCCILACQDILVDTWNYRRQIIVKYLVSSKSASKCLGSVCRVLKYLTASFILLGGLEGRSGHLPKERLVFLQKSMCSGVLIRPQEQFNSAESCLNLVWYHAKSPCRDRIASRWARIGRESVSSIGVFVVW